MPWAPASEAIPPADSMDSAAVRQGGDVAGQKADQAVAGVATTVAVVQVGEQRGCRRHGGDVGGPDHTAGGGLTASAGAGAQQPVQRHFRPQRQVVRGLLG
ncbi:hypothetical protein [Frankia sp. Cr1]|uniref:hypothetical protein n=1 Tax=Frankia sp. Cr1 TaxID=3073931 RepID=UPI002AD2D1D0|nr:hypothetical protein [Frankia sp. Cr1]